MFCEIRDGRDRPDDLVSGSHATDGKFDVDLSQVIRAVSDQDVDVESKDPEGRVAHQDSKTGVFGLRPNTFEMSEEPPPTNTAVRT